MSFVLTMSFLPAGQPIRYIEDAPQVCVLVSRWPVLRWPWLGASALL